MPELATTLALERYDADAKALVVAAQALADERKHAEVQPLHLLVRALARDARVRAVFERAASGSLLELEAAAESALRSLPRSGEVSYLSLGMQDLLQRAEREADRERSSDVRVEQILNALSQEIRGPAGELLTAFGVLPGALRPHMAALRSPAGTAAGSATEPGRYLRPLVVDPAEPVLLRAKELERLQTILSRRQKNHPLLVGEAGVGKSAIVRALAQRMAKGEVMAELVSTRLFEVELGGLFGGARLRGEVEERVRKLLAEAADERAVVWVRHIEQLFGQGPSAALVGELFRTALMRSELRLLGTTSLDGLKKMEERDPELVRQFTRLSIEEPSLADATEMVRGVRGRYERHHGVEIGDGAIALAVQLAKRYVVDRRLPDSALDLLDEAAAAERVRPKPEMGSENAARAALGERGVAETLAQWTGIPVAKMLEGEAEKLLQMEARLAERVVGQDEAVAAVSRAVRRSRVGLRDPKKPIGSFLFLGPSGVGKTELAKALAGFLFDDEQALTRLDMSEFMERHMAQRLLGAPPGYADSEHGGFLTEAVRKRPYSVLLFDEVEKAHPDVFNLLLQVLDEGRLTDGRGRLADFSNSLVIMTSNIGSDRILEADPQAFEHELGREALRAVLEERLRSFFRPEFLNRIDETLLFRPLGKAQLQQVLAIQVAALERLLAPRGLKLALREDAKAFLVDRGYDPALGARPIKRSVLRHLQDPLAHALLTGRIPEGSTVEVQLEGDALAFAPRALTA